MATGMDISADGQRAVVSTYGLAFEYTRLETESWTVAFGREAKPIFSPFRRQGESICYGSDGKTLYFTSEKLPTPFFELKATPQ